MERESSEKVASIYLIYFILRLHRTFITHATKVMENRTITTLFCELCHKYSIQNSDRVVKQIISKYYVYVCQSIIVEFTFFTFWRGSFVLATIKFNGFDWHLYKSFPTFWTMSPKCSSKINEHNFPNCNDIVEQKSLSFRLCLQHRYTNDTLPFRDYRGVGPLVTDYLLQTYNRL
jgi:hypothetical protein